VTNAGFWYEPAAVGMASSSLLLLTLTGLCSFALLAFSTSAMIASSDSSAIPVVVAAAFADWEGSPSATPLAAACTATAAAAGGVRS